MLVSLRDTHPVVRSYLIREGAITEEPVEVPGLEVPGAGRGRGRAPGLAPCRIVTESVNNQPARPRGWAGPPSDTQRGGPVAVEVRLPTVLRSQAGGSSVVSVDGATIGEVLSKLVAEYPGMAGQVLTDEGALHKFVNIYVNDDDVRYLQGLDTPVADGAEVSILPAVAGG